MTSLGVLRNHLAAAAVTAVHREMSHVFRSKRLRTVEARARYVVGLFRSDDDHPIIWRQYVEGNIQNHPEVGGYKTVRGTYFQYRAFPSLNFRCRPEEVISSQTRSWKPFVATIPRPASWSLPQAKIRDPETDHQVPSLLSLLPYVLFDTSSYAMLISCQVERAYKGYLTGDFVEPTQQFNAEFSGPATARYMAYIVNDLNDRHWNSIFSALSLFTVRVLKEEAVHSSAPTETHERVLLPLSDPPSPPRDD